ncbi:MAG: hypothetical protein ACETWQ_03195 [Phycisphaerae bacterium]
MERFKIVTVVIAVALQHIVVANAFAADTCSDAPSGEKISEQVAVVTELPLAVEVTYWDISLETDLPNNRLKLKAICTVRNNGSVPVESLDFDILAGERFYGVHVEIANIAKLTNDKEVKVSFKRFIEEPPEDPDLAGTHKYPLVTRVPLLPALKQGEECRLAFDYTVTCPDIAQRRHYNLIWEPKEGKKEICLISDFTWFPRLATDLQKWRELAGDKNFFPRGSRPAWRATLTHPAELEGMVIEGKVEKTERAGEHTVSRWRSITGGRPQVFIGPAERVERKTEAVTVVFLLPEGNYNREFVDAVGDLVIHAHGVFTDWFGPFDANEVHIVAPSGIRGGHGAFMGMTVDASYFQMNRGERITELGKFFTQTPVHELAHSCWPESYGRGTKFLRESLANFATWHLAREHYGLDIFKSTLQQLIERAKADKPLFNPTGDEEQFAYEKGPIVLDLLRQEMGDEVFFRTLMEYVRRYKNTHVTFIDFVAVCNDVSGRDWMPFFYQWCYGKACPAYHLVGFESKESQAVWETKVTIRNSGVGIVRCPLQLQMDGQSQEEVFWVPEGQEKTFVYQTDKEVVGAVVDPNRIAYQANLAEKREEPAYFVNSLGFGRKSNQEIASKYTQEWLEQIADPGVLFRTGLALYDLKRYDDALTVFENMGEKAGESRVRQAIALIWQGHMLDLLGRRDEAISTYQKVVEMDTKQELYVRHDQFGLAYHPSPYASERMSTPFNRVENLRDD